MIGEIIIGVLLTFLSFVILYFVIKGAVREGVKEAYGDLTVQVQLRQITAAGIKEANKDLEKEQKKDE